MTSLPGGRKLVSKHRSLKQDYDDLFRETQGLEARVQEAKDRRSRLLAEVRFLWRKHKILSSNQMSTNRKEKISRQNLEAPSRGGHWRKSSKGDCPPKQNDALLDLNQASETMEQYEEVRVIWEPLALEKKAKVDIIEKDPLMSDLQLAICQGNGNNAIDGGNDGIERLVAKGRSHDKTR